MDAIKVAAAMLLLCTSAMVDASTTAAGTNPANPEQFRVPKSQRCAFHHALCVVNCTDSSGPGKPDPPQLEECNKRCTSQITCRGDGSTAGDDAAWFENVAGQFGDNKSFFGKKLLCSFKRAICLVNCSGGLRRGPVDPETPPVPSFSPGCSGTCSKENVCN